MDWFILTIIFRVLAILFFGILLSEFLAVQVSKRTANLLSTHSRYLLRKAVFYAGVAIVLLMTLHELNFKLTALLGAAGIAGVAIAFAAQTSISNMISGLFLLLERPFEIGDRIQVGGSTGDVESIDLMSIRLRGLENALVRIPNEVVLKSQVTNYTRNDVQYIGFEIVVAGNQDMEKVQQVLRGVLNDHEDCLDSPPPEAYCTNISADRCVFCLHAFSKRENYLALQSELLKAVKAKCDAESISLA